MAGSLFVISAPSGAGKTSLVKALVAADPGVRLSVSHTTRPRRPGEVNGEDYHFIDADRFRELESAGEFLERAEVYGNRYGTSRTWIAQRMATGEDVLLEIDWQGAAQVRKAFPDALTVFVLPPSITELRRRLMGRGQDSENVIALRMDQARSEIGHVEEFDYVIINDDFSLALEGLRSIVQAARLRRRAQLSRHARLIESFHSET
jgi:guanylate kinase